MASTSDKKIIVKSSDGETFEVEHAVALESQTIKHMIGDCYNGTEILISDVTGMILAKVIEYCKKHVAAASSEDKPSDFELKKWDADFLKVDLGTLFNLMLAAKFLDIKSLVDLTCQVVAEMMTVRDMNLEEVRKIFGIVNDYTPEEEEEVRRENQWAFEKI